MKTNLEGQSKKILKVCFWMNIILIIVLIFYSSLKLFLITTIINVILLGSYFIIEKYSSLFGLMIGKRKLPKILNKSLGSLNG